MGENPNRSSRVQFLLDKTPCRGCGKVHLGARIYPITGGGFPSRIISSVEDGIRLLDEGLSVGCITPKQRGRLFRQLVDLGLPLSEAEAVEQHAKTVLGTVQKILDQRGSPDDPVMANIMAALEAAIPGAMVVRIRDGDISN